MAQGAAGTRDGGTMNREVLLVDCDGPLGDFVGHAVPWLSEHSGLPLTVADILYHDILSAVPRDTLRAFWRMVDATPGWVEAMPVYPGAADALEQLRRAYHVVCVTAQHHGPTWVYERSTWLRRHFGFHPDDVIFAKAKWHIAGAALIDDNPTNCLAWSRARSRPAVQFYALGYAEPSPPQGMVRLGPGWEGTLAALGL